MPKIPKQRTGSGGWPDRRRVPAPKKDKGCLMVVVPVLGFIAAVLWMVFG